tara:strand:- start:5431 stop:5703 length:273 start_codon:yes stop_codon:yes gene_type:complete
MLIIMEEQNEILNEKVSAENELKDIIINYVGEQMNPENNEVTVEMVVEIFARDFPEFLLVIAEENFLRGYQQAFADVDAHEKMKNEEKPG